MIKIPNQNNLISNNEVIELLRVNNIIVNDKDTIKHWVNDHKFPQPEETYGYCRDRCVVFYDKNKVATWIDCYKKIMKKPDTRTRSKKQMKKVYEVYELVISKRGSTMASDLLYNEEAIKDVEAKCAPKESNNCTILHLEGGTLPTEEDHPFMKNEMRVVHTQFTNGEIEYLTGLNEEIHNILDYIQNFVVIEIPEINIITDSDSAIKFHKNIFTTANVIQFILKTLKEATNKIEEHNIKINNIIDSFVKRIAEK